jgi:predicted enzyme related to lactoylglutathione lyase
MTTVETKYINRPAWFDLMTTDAEDARRFYGELFGWTFEVGGPESGFYAMCKASGRNAAGIGQMQGNEGHPPAWTVYFNVDDIEQSMAAVKANGGQVMMGPMDVFDAGRMAICMDNSNAVFGMWQPLAHTGSQVENEHGAMAWSEVNTRDAKKASEFYANVFALSPQTMEGTPSEYYMLNQGQEPTAGVMQMTQEWGDIPPHWMTYFAVANLKSAMARVKSGGGQIVHGPFQSPYGEIAVALDPQGAGFSIIELANPTS